MDRFQNAILMNDIEKIKKIINDGGDINRQNKLGMNVLYFAILHKRRKIISFVLENGADVHAQDVDGDTALHACAYEGDVETMEKLIKKGVNIHAKSHDRTTALHQIFMNSESLPQVRRIKMIVLLLKACANRAARETLVNARNKFEAIALHSACYVNDIQSATLFIRAGANVNAQDAQGDTPLHNAAHGDHYESVCTLVDADADVSIVNKQGETCYSIAEGNENELILKKLQWAKKGE